MSTYKNLSHHSHSQKHKDDKLPMYRPLDELVGESMKHKNILIGAVALILTATLGYVGFTSYQNNIREKSASLLKETPKAVLEQYPNSDAAVVAHVKLAAEAMEKSQWDEALTHYQALSEKKSLPAMIRISSTQNLALVYLKKGDKETALQTLQKVALDPENAHQDYTKLLEAHVWEAKGDQAKADEIYKQLSEGAVSNEIKEEAKSHIKTPEKPEEKSEEKPTDAKADGNPEIKKDSKAEIKKEASKPAQKVNQKAKQKRHK